MAESKTEKTKEQRIRAERSRLRKVYKELSETRKKLAEPLIERAAFMRIELEDQEADLNKNGWTELFRQSEKVEPYERARPLAQEYLSLNGNYQKIIKGLDSLLPSAASVPKNNTTDPFDEFIRERG